MSASVRIRLEEPTRAAPGALVMNGCAFFFSIADQLTEPAAKRRVCGAFACAVRASRRLPWTVRTARFSFSWPSARGPGKRPRAASSSSLRRAAGEFSVSEPGGAIVPPPGLTRGGRTTGRTRNEVAKTPRPWAKRQGAANERFIFGRRLAAPSVSRIPKRIHNIEQTTGVARHGENTGRRRAPVSPQF